MIIIRLKRVINNMGEEFKHKKVFNKRNINYAVTALVISTAVFISYFAVKDLGIITGYVGSFLRKLLGALTPLVIGIILAYLFNRPVMFFERFLGKLNIKRTLSIGILYLLIIGLVVALVNIVFPRMQESLVRLIYDDLPRYSIVINENIQQSMEWLKSFDLKFDYNNIQDYVSKFTNLSSVVLDGLMGFAKSLTQGVLNFVLAMILAFYVLQNKEKLINSISELIYLYGGQRVRERVITEAKEVDSILSGYISGMLIDALTVSILVITGLKLIGHNYFLLMGVSIGILNLIPYFGSLIGCTIACLLALLQGVSEAVYTLVLLIIIQQIDGNVIQPRIVGNRVGLEPLWVITAVLMFGTFWGIPGMIIAVPFTALLKAILIRVIDKKRAAVKKIEAARES